MAPRFVTRESHRAACHDCTGYLVLSDDTDWNVDRREEATMLKVLVGFALYMSGGMLIFTVIGAPLGILLFAAGLGLMLEPARNRG
jgi:hypothetical protein